MGFLEGVVWSLAGAVAHSAIDVLRKLGSQRMAPADLVAVVTVYDTIIATAGVIAVEGSLPDMSTFTNTRRFFIVVSLTSALAVLGRLLYQRALSIAPLSLTVPYLAFTPAFVVLISPFFLAGEVPSPLGMLGVFVVSISGYMLGLVTAPCTGEQPSSPSKAKLPTAAAPLRKSISATTLVQTQQQQDFHPLLPRQEDLQQRLQDQHQQHQQQRFHEQWNDHNHTQISDSHPSNSRGKSRGSQMSVWAMAYYKGKAPRSPATVAAPAELQQYAEPPVGQLVSSSSGMMSDGNVYDSSNGIRVVHNSNSSCKDSGSSRRADFDSQAKFSKDNGSRVDSRVGSRTAAANANAAAHRAAKLLGHRSGRSSMRHWFAAVTTSLSGPSAAPALVLTAAFLYSLTASLDKLGIAAANHNLAAYFLGQRLVIGLCGAVYLLCFARHALRHIVRDALLLFSISVVEQLAVVFYLVAINNMLVSYVVAIKRINVLLSTLVGCVLFKENVRQRIPYIVVMLCGMLMIVLQPGHEFLHHSHHTRHLHHQPHHLFLL
eukprot:GHUV01006889.1.p1 GENE.GHUV01006889.1~~GHUV01006889.1.p1  ORF type:complete len:545 (+),score=161.78 GHUV01006889.1:647-2281(+)